MTTTTHTYTAELTPGDIALGVIGGRVTLDVEAAPHVQAGLTIAMPDDATLAALDPRNAPRLRITVDATLPAGTQHREFDLSVRSLDVQHSTATVQIEAASDESILLDYAPLADDVTPRDHEASLRDVIDYVLGEAIPGASLETSPAGDADITRYWELTNRVLNPRADSTSNYAIGSSATSLGTGSSSPAIGSAYVRWTSVAAGNTFLQVMVDDGCSVGEEITAVAQMRTGTGGLDGRVMIRFLNADGVKISDRYGPEIPLATGTGWTTVSHTTTAPAGTSRVEFYLAGVATGSGQTFAGDGVMLYAGDEVVEFFSGSSVIPGYTTTWEDASNASASTRTPDIERDQESLTWTAGQSALDFLRPLVQAAGFRLVCDETRNWTLRGTDYLAPGSLNIRYGVNMTDGSDSLTREESYDAAVTIYEWTGRDGITRRRVDGYALTDPYTRCVLFEKYTPYPGPGFSEYAVQRAQQRGRVVQAAKVADWAVTAEMACAFAVPGADTQTGKTERVVFDLDRDEITATSRTSDTPEHAWLLALSGAWTTGPIGEGWDEAA